MVGVGVDLAPRCFPRKARGAWRHAAHQRHRRRGQRPPRLAKDLRYVWDGLARGLSQGGGLPNVTGVMVKRRASMCTPLLIPFVASFWPICRSDPPEYRITSCCLCMSGGGASLHGSEVGMLSGVCTQGMHPWNALRALTRGTYSGQTLRGTRFLPQTSGHPFVGCCPTPKPPVRVRNPANMRPTGAPRWWDSALTPASWQRVLGSPCEVAWHRPIPSAQRARQSGNIVSGRRRGNCRRLYGHRARPRLPTEIPVFVRLAADPSNWLAPDNPALSIEGRIDSGWLWGRSPFVTKTTKRCVLLRLARAWRRACLAVPR